MSARYLWTRKCAVEGCNSSATEYRLFRFPQGKSPCELLRYHKWVNFTKNPSSVQTSPKHCSLSTTAVATAHFVGFCNKLFDSVNGATAKPQGAGGIRCQLRKERENLHLNFWEQSIKEIKTWKVAKDDHVKSSTKSDVKVIRPPCLSGWITTLQGLKLLWDVLKEKGFGCVLPRSINQGPIEHLFGCVRSNCGSNMNPTVTQFVAVMKTSLINGLVFTDLKVSNCGEEESDPGEPKFICSIYHKIGSLFMWV